MASAVGAVSAAAFFAGFEGVGAGEAVLGLDPAGGEGDAFVGFVADAAGGDGGGCHVEQEGFAVAAGGGEGDGVGAEAGLGGAGGGDLDAGGRRGDEADEAGVGGHFGVEAAGAEMRGVADGGDADADGLRLGDGGVHGEAGGDVAEAAIAIDEGGDRGFLDDAGFGAHAHFAVGGAGGVSGDHGDAVAVDAVEVGPGHDFGGAFGVFGGHAEGGEEAGDLAAVDFVGGGHVRPPGRSGW